MPSPYFLRYKNTIIGIFVETNEGLKYYPSQDTADKIPNGLGYPLGLFPLDTEASGLIPNKNHIPTPEDITLWLSDRVFPKDRQGVEALLQEIGLAEYDMWKITKITKGISLSDYYWLSSNPDEQYKDVHPRFVVNHSYKVESDNLNNRKINTVIKSYSELKKSLNNNWENIDAFSTVNWKTALPEDITNLLISNQKIVSNPSKSDIKAIEEIMKTFSSLEWDEILENVKQFEKLNQKVYPPLISEAHEKKNEEIEIQNDETGKNKNIDDVWN